MDKNTYETYEYLPANTNASESDQFFVVQDDGTFLLNRQVQYVAQVQDVKEVLEEVQPCTVYGVGVSSQQFYVDNSNELISVPDQFVLPNGENNLYTNGYLIQPSSSNDSEQIEENVDEHLKQSITQESNVTTSSTNNQANNFTEVTLSDEQYQTLEQKGWILLETNNKTFVLNSLGLHDITTDDKLIQKLKNEIQNENSSGTESGDIKIETTNQDVPNLTQRFTNDQEPVEFVVENSDDQENSINNIQFIITDKEDNSNLNSLENEEQMEICDDSRESDLKCRTTNEIATVKQEPLVDKSSIKIKTKFNFKDIPEKIILGKTVNGKRLVAKVVKTVTNLEIANNYKKDNKENPDTNQQSANHNTVINETELISLIQESVRAGLQKKIKPEVVQSTKNVIAPLLKVPNLKNALDGHNVIITKIRNNKDSNGIINKSKVTLLTGQIVNNDEHSAVFEFLPDLLQTIKAKSEESMGPDDQHLEFIDHEKETFVIFHIHIIEIKDTDKVVKVSVTLNKRQLSINQMFDLKKRHPNTIFACSACANLYKSETALKEHQENDCLGTEETLTIDMVDTYPTIKSESNKTFSCTQCNLNFPKLATCMRHVKSHFGLQELKSSSNKETETSSEQTIQNKAVYKCKMCPCTYFHPATLSKHIVTRHIKIKGK